MDKLSYLNKKINLPIGWFGLINNLVVERKIEYSLLKRNKE